ncbi:hypothetical protein NOR_01996 [Metarhizium rileyi]|uniref:Uncharacterized protein n=1 Tax=Metarhizium rileyi (strain RCEF 4871) TaxID=1649241 RepID=A0A167I790_METRR|nr:hypothetical protein NOR_01996 [Metarhizium rileyi RCEF 4871]
MTSEQWVPDLNKPKGRVKAMQKTTATHDSFTVFGAVDSFRGILEAQELQRLEELQEKPDKGHIQLGREEMDNMFGYITQDHFPGPFPSEELEREASVLFVRERGFSRAESGRTGRVEKPVTFLMRALL